MDGLKSFQKVNSDVPYALKDSYTEKCSIRWSPDVTSWITNGKIAAIIGNEQANLPTFGTRGKVPVKRI